jgi:hypothetical protein
MARQPTSMRLRESNQITRIPRVDFTNQRVQAQGLSQLASSLDRLSSFFLNQAADKAKIEGAEYGAANAPTPQQINEAYASGEELELPGDDTTIYGRSVRKAALSVADDEITALASNRMSTLAAVFDTSLNDESMTDQQRADLAASVGVDDFSPQSFATALDTINAGYASVLDENAPGVSRKFRAQAAITANNKYNTYLDSFVKKNNERLEASFLQAHESIFSVDSVRDDLVGVNGLVNIENRRKAQTQKSISFLSGSEIKTFQDNMDEVEKTAALQVLTDGTFAQKEPVKVISDIQNNRMAKLPIGVQNSVRLLKKQGMSNTEIAKQLRSLRSDQINFEENEQAAVNARAEEALKKLKADVITAMGQGNTDAFNTAIAALRANHPLEATTLEEKFIEAGRRRTVSDPDVRSNLVNLISSAELSFDDVAAAVADGTLSNKDIEYFQGKANSIENEEFAETANFMRGLFELPANYTAIKDTDPNYEKARIFARLRGNLERRLTQARQTRQEFDAFEIMEELVANETGAITSVENQIKIASGNKIIGLINGFERELAQIGQDKFEEGAFQSAIDFLQAQKRLESRNRIPALRNRDDQSIAGFIKNLTDALEVSQ